MLPLLAAIEILPPRVKMSPVCASALIGLLKSMGNELFCLASQPKRLN